MASDRNANTRARNADAQRRRLLLSQTIANLVPEREYQETELLHASGAYAEILDEGGKDCALGLLRGDLAALRDEGCELKSEKDGEVTTWTYVPGMLFEPKVTALNIGILRLLIHENRRNSDGGLGRLTAGDFELERAFIKLGGRRGKIAIPDIVGKENFGNRPSMTRTEPASRMLFRIIDAIQDRERIRFGYRSAGSRESTPRTLDPQLVFRYLGNDYVSGFAARAGTAEEAFEWRTFRLSRITTPYDEVERVAASGLLSSDRLAAVLSEASQDRTVFYRIAEVDVAVRAGTCMPIRKLGTPVRAGEGTMEGWDRFLLRNVDRQLLWEKLVYFGRDMRLLGPEDVLADYRKRLAHLSGLGK